MISINKTACNETHSVWFLGLNGAIFLFGFFLIDLKNDMYRHMDLTIDTSSRAIHYEHALVITWFKPTQGHNTDFQWTMLIDNLVFAHSLFLISAALLAIITWPFHKSPATFTTYCLLLSTAMIIRVFVLTSFMEPSSRIYHTSINSALAELEWSYRVLSNSSYVSSLNAYMVNAECCGFYGPLDFMRVNLSIHVRDYLYPFQRSRETDLYFPSQEVIHKFKVPPACCKPYLFNAGNPKQRFEAVARCAEGMDRKNQQWTGCMQRVEEHIRDKWLYLTVLLSVMFATEHLIFFFIALATLILKRFGNVKVISLTIAIYLTFLENKESHSASEPSRKQVRFDTNDFYSTESEVPGGKGPIESKGVQSATSIHTSGSSVDAVSSAGTGSSVDDGHDFDSGTSGGTHTTRGSQST